MASLFSIVDGIKNHILTKYFARPYIPNDLTISFYTSGVHQGKNVLYLASPAVIHELIHKNAEINVFIHDGDENAADLVSLADGTQLNLVVTSLPLPHLYSHLNSVIEAYRKQTANLIELAFRERSIQSIFDACMSFSKAEIFLEDENDNIISPNADANRNYNSEGKKELAFGGSSVHGYRDSDPQNIVMKADVPNGLAGKSRAKVVINCSAYNMSYDYHALLLDICLAISKIIDDSEYNYWMSSELEKFLHDIVEKNVTEEAEISSRLIHIFGQNNKFYIFVIVDFKDSSSVDLLSAIKILEDCIPGGKAASYNNQVVLMVPTESANCEVAFDNEKLSEFLKKYDACIAFGNGTSFRCKLRTMFFLCREIMEIGKLLRTSQNRRIFYFSEYSTYLSMRFSIEGLRQLTGDDDVLVLGHPDCVRVFDYDKKNKDNLLDVLYYYLTSNCNYQKTAAVSFMHRNTIVYKVKKLNQLLGYDISLCADTYRLLFSAELYRFYFRMLASRYKSSELSIDFPTCMQGIDEPNVEAEDEK